jgi:signal transduction histidine kinase
MSAMRERAEAAGGRLAVSSAPGEGATVRIVVPL